jgi:hypothetical protein
MIGCIAGCMLPLAFEMFAGFFLLFTLRKPFATAANDYKPN